MKTIKSKNSFIEFEDLFDEDELEYKKCKKKKKNKKKHKSSKKSSNKKKNKKKIMKNNIKITSDFFNLNDTQLKETKNNYNNIIRHSKSFAARIANCVNVDAKLNVDISDDCINNLFIIASGIISKILFKK